MRRLLPLLGVVVALTLSGNAAADTFRVAHSHARRAAAEPSAQSSGPVIAFTQSQSGPMSFGALRGIWQAAGATYGIPWQVLGAINKVETNFGANLGPSSAGAIGWMQFMPSTWARWGVDANGDGIADPDNPPTRSSAQLATSPAAAVSSTSREPSIATTTRTPT